MEPGTRAGMYPPPYAQQAAPPPGGHYAPPPNYAIHHGVEGVHAAPALRHGYGNPYVHADKVADCRSGYGAAVSPERRRKNRVANALAAAFIVCWCCTWPCHGPCCCGL